MSCVWGCGEMDVTSYAHPQEPTVLLNMGRPHSYRALGPRHLRPFFLVVSTSEMLPEPDPAQP